MLEELRTGFNARSSHRLPIAHIVSKRGHPTYNKYGIAQRHLRGQNIEFPANLSTLSWGEAELLVKVLALLALPEQH